MARNARHRRRVLRYGTWQGVYELGAGSRASLDRDRGAVLPRQATTTSCWSDTGERLQFERGRRSSSRETSGRGKCSSKCVSPAMSTVLQSRQGDWHDGASCSRARAVGLCSVRRARVWRHHSVLLQDKIAAYPRLLVRAVLGRRYSGE
jgi:hypothetical protein